MGVDGEEVEEVTEEPTDDLRGALESAFDASANEDVEAKPVETPVNDNAEAPPVEPEAKETKGRDEKGRFAPKEAKPESATTKQLKAVPAIPGNPPPVPPTPEVKAPQSWKATVREKWGTLPPEVQQEVIRRERETAMALAETAEARKGWDSFRQIMGPYEAQIRSEGSDPLRAVQNLMQTAQALRTAPAGHKAQLVANIVKTFGVPIEALDAALAGQPMPQQAQQQGQYQDPRVDQLLARLQQAEQQRTQSISQRSQQDVESFGQQREFFDDVREDMADMIELASKRGLELSLEDAYNRAVKLHPDISEVLQQREAAKKVANVQASTQRARAAASSVRSRPSGVSYTKEPEDLRGSIEASIAALSGG